MKKGLNNIISRESRTKFVYVFLFCFLLFFPLCCVNFPLLFKKSEMEKQSTACSENCKGLVATVSAFWRKAAALHSTLPSQRQESAVLWKQHVSKRGALGPIRPGKCSAGQALTCWMKAYVFFWNCRLEMYENRSMHVYRYHIWSLAKKWLGFNCKSSLKELIIIKYFQRRLKTSMYL